jgi:hypothetical protein
MALGLEGSEEAKTVEKAKRAGYSAGCACR